MESNHWRRKQGPTLHTAQAVLSCIPAYVRHYRSTRALISLLAVTVPTAFCNKRAIGAGTGPGSCTGGLHILQKWPQHPNSVFTQIQLYNTAAPGRFAR